MILGRILSNSPFKSSPFATASLHYRSFTPSRFSSNNVGHQIRCFSVEPRFDLRRIREPDDAVALFQEMLRMRPRPAVIDFTRLLSVVVDMKQYSLALQLFDQMLQTDASIKRSTSSIVMALFHKMVRMQPSPSVIDCTKFVSAVVKIKQYSLAIHLFDEMLRMDAPMNHYTLSVAIDCFCHLKRPKYGFAILGSFFKRGCEPNVVTFTTLVKGLMLVGEISESTRLLGKLMTENLCYPNEITYLTLISGLCKSGHTLQAFDFLMLLEKGSCKPNVRAYNMVIHGLCKEGRVEAAEHILKMMKQVGVQPNIFTFTSFINGYCLVGEIERARNIFDSAANSGLKPDIVSYTTLMSGYCRKGQVDEVLRLFIEIPAKGLEHNVVSCSMMLHSLFSARRCEEGLKLFREMQARRLPCDVITYSTLINGLCSFQRLGEAFSVLHMMEEKGITPNIVTYTTLIDGLGKGKRVDMAKHVFGVHVKQIFSIPRVIVRG